MIKFFSLAIGLSILSLSATASATSFMPKAFCVADQTYSRSVSTGGLFGQPEAVRQHSLKFEGMEKVIDNGSTFFGNPPEVLDMDYDANSNQIFLKDAAGHEVVYTISDDCTSISSDEQVFFKETVEDAMGVVGITPWYPH